VIPNAGNAVIYALSSNSPLISTDGAHPLTSPQADTGRFQDNQDNIMMAGLSDGPTAIHRFLGEIMRYRASAFD
jgi:hypothetical protein